MLTFHRNLSRSHPVEFKNKKALRDAVIKDPFFYDGLAYFPDEEFGDAILVLSYVECYEHWEVEFMLEPSSFKKIENAIDDFIAWFENIDCF